jgi:hypothetical protein
VLGRREFNAHFAGLRVLADVGDCLLRGAKRHHVRGHAESGKLPAGVHRHRYTGLGRQPVGLPPDRGRQ